MVELQRIRTSFHGMRLPDSDASVPGYLAHKASGSRKVQGLRAVAALGVVPHHAIRLATAECLSRTRITTGSEVALLKIRIADGLNRIAQLLERSIPS